MVEVVKGERSSADKVRFYYVYILRCSNDSSYIGCTSNLKERLNRHEQGHVPATKNILPVLLITYFAFQNKYTAYNFERYLKSGSGRAFTKKHAFSLDERDEK